MKKRPCTEIGTLTQEVDDTGVDEAWADPEVRETFRKSQNLNYDLDLELEGDLECKNAMIDEENYSEKVINNFMLTTIFLVTGK